MTKFWGFFCIRRNTAKSCHPVLWYTSHPHQPTHTYFPLLVVICAHFCLLLYFFLFCFPPYFFFPIVSLQVEVKSSLCLHKVHIMKNFFCTLKNSRQKITNWPGFPLLCTSHFLNVPIPGCANLVARPFEGLLLASLNLSFPTKCSQGPLRWDPISNSLCLMCTWAPR